MKGPKDAKSSGRHFGAAIAAAAVVVAVIAGGIALVIATRGGPSPSESATQQGAGELPAFAYTSSETLAGYQAAVANQELFSKMPCYCGCGTHAIAHRDLKECFIKPDGTFESHASACQTCVNIAADVVKWQAEGLSAKAIRQEVEAKYSRYGPSTDTPPITDG